MKWIVVTIFFSLFDWNLALSRSKKKKNKKKHQSSLIERSIRIYKGRYRNGDITVSEFWQKLNDLEVKNATKLKKKDRNSIDQLKTALLYTDKYHLLSIFHAARILKNVKNPFDKKLYNLWKILYSVSDEVSAQYLVEDLAIKLKSFKNLPPFFKNDWYYILGNAYLERSKPNKSLANFRKISLKSKYFLPSQFQIAIINLQKNKTKKAEIALNTIISQGEKNRSSLTSEQKLILDYSYSALARLHYASQNFLTSVRYYRKIPKNSPLYYDSLFEQSWSLFLSGNTNHSLGTLYGVGSTFFKDEFNPEAEILEAIIYFWLCRYTESRYALFRFMKNYEKAVSGLDSFLKSKRINNERAFQLFEDLISGVSSDSLGIQRNVLLTAANKDTMLIARSQYVAVMEERQRLRSSGIFGNRSGIGDELRQLDAIEKILRERLGETYKNELIDLNDQFKELHGQAQFLQLELLMSEKDHILGKELHAESKVYSKNFQDNLKSWGENSQSWEDKKGEFWWDEIGYHIVKAKSECLVNN